MELHIGLDDADSPLGQCTTYLAYLISSEILENRLGKFLDYPYLVRLNPNIPFKTRGNGAISIHLDVSPEKFEKIRESTIRVLEENAEAHGKTSPSLVLLRGKVPGTLSSLYKRALRELTPRKYVVELLHEVSREHPVEVYPHEKNRGLVGALSALGAYPLKEFTYELLAYRSPDEKDLERKVPEKFFVEMDRKYRPRLFATYDYVEKRLLATPHGPDPVVFGLRSVDPRILEEILRKVSGKLPYRYIIFKTNQATNAHLTVRKKISAVRPYDSVLIEGKIERDPQILKGGHVKILAADDTGKIQVMVYRETGRLNRVARLLRRGDVVEIGGGTVPRMGLTLNAEQIRLKKPAPIARTISPQCPKCGATMKSAGRNKGYKCPKCGYRDRNASKKVVLEPRIVEPGLYIASPRAYRHLTMPPEIYGLEKIDVHVDKWIV